MKKIFFILLFLGMISPMFSQKNLTCLDFYKGEFKVINDSNPLLNSTVIRKGESQIDISNNEEKKLRVVWRNDCSYSLYYLKKEARKDNFKKVINREGGIVVTIDRIEGKTAYHTISYFDGKRHIKDSGTQIKISNTTSFK